ncbi:hypothetical protein [Bacillus thuringiensis]|uniref:hypothetical protein n=1 Tax=Bacillus thuringiensis TaxID=1428 RepID=UPI0021D67D6C|nr:hypothetical protein [Bacillus thuringiensis]MCU7667648.1 hypothetical protein [Bacillus thuringiensis]
MSKKSIVLNLSNNNEVKINDEIINEINEEYCFVSAIVNLPDNYISEVIISNYGFYKDFRKLNITIYKNENDGHPSNVIQSNEIVVSKSNVINALLGKQILRTETGKPIEYFITIDK